MSPWYCYKEPGTVGVGGHDTTQWFFETDAPFIPEALHRFSMTERCLDAATSFEDMCLAFERAYAANVEGVLCECCQTRGSEARKHATGWHICDGDRAALAAVLREDQQPEPRWKAGTLHAGKLDNHNMMWALARRFVPLEILRDARWCALVVTFPLLVSLRSILSFRPSVYLWRRLLPLPGSDSDEDSKL